MKELLDPHYKKTYHYENGHWVLNCYIKGCKNKKADIMEVYCWPHLIQFYKDGSMKNDRMIRKVEQELNKGIKG